MGFSFRPEDPSEPTANRVGDPAPEDAHSRGAAQADGAPEAPGDVSSAPEPRDGGRQADSSRSPEDQLEAQRDRYLRLAAEYDNYRKRAARERQEASARGQADLAKALVDGLDDLARFAHVDPATVDASTIVHGVELVERKMLKALTSVGLEVINPVDQTFDPALHEAVGTESALSREDDHVIARVYQPGYLFAGQLLRPARVLVKQWNG